jgi:Domain of unknown function (DUF4333)
MSPFSRTAALARGRVLVFAVAAVAIAFTGCTKTLSLEATKTSIQEGLAKQLELEIASIACPAESRPLEAGDSFECTATLGEGATVVVKVAQTDDQGNIQWEVTKSQGLFNMRKAEAEVAQGLLAQASVETTVTCGAAWRTGKVGDTFDCSVETADGQTSTAVITVKDLAGSISWAVE